AHRLSANCPRSGRESWAPWKRNPPRWRSAPWPPSPRHRPCAPHRPHLNDSGAWSLCRLMLLDGRAGEKPAGRLRYIRLPHQAFANEKGADARASKPDHIGMSEDAALGDDDVVLRHARGQCLGNGKIGDEGLEVAVVDADEPRVEEARAVELCRTVHFRKHVH